MKNKKHLIYALCEPVSGLIRYVGRSSIGMGRPNYHATHALKRNEDGSWVSELYVHRWVRDLLLNGSKPGVRILEEFDPTDDVNERLNEAEARWIRDLIAEGHRLTNATEGGGGILGYHHDEESKRKISEASSKMWRENPHGHSEESRKKIGEASRRRQLFGGNRKGILHSEETRRKISEIQTGQKRPDQSGDRHWTRRPDAVPPHVRPVVCVDDGRRFVSVTEAARQTGVSVATIQRDCAGQGPTKRYRKRLKFAFTED